MIRNRPLMALYRRPWPISSAVAPQLHPSIPVEEEKTPNYHANRFFPIHLGQILDGRYQVATKLGYGANSTVWLARDLTRWRWSHEKYVAIKVNATKQPSRQTPLENELDIMTHIAQVDPQHKGWHFIRKLSDSFTLQGTSSIHDCLVLEALREPLWLYRGRYIGGVVPPDILKILVQMILHALDYLHSECCVIHTDLKPDNIMVKIEDASILERDVQDEFENPLPQKHLDGRIIQIADFDLSVRTSPGQIHMGAIQGEMYRAPEVILNAGYTYSADIWSLGVMLWDLLEGKGLFDPTVSSEDDEYDDQSHLAQITALIGPPPGDLLSRGQRTSMFYKPDGELKNADRIPCDFNLENTIKCMTGEEKVRFIEFIRRIVRWSPEERSTARELLQDPWLHEDFSQD
ncbi:hypothetical protein FSST1_009892 [Fusarium sambucinum]